MTAIDPRGRPSVPGGDAVEGHSRNGFEHWKLDGDSEGGSSGNDGPPLAANVRVEATESRPSDFSSTTTICGIDFEVRREGKHSKLHLYKENQIYRFEPLSQAIPKLVCILAAARLAVESE